MKLIIAIVSKSDTKPLIKALLKGGYSVTKMSSTGGFLKVGTNTLLIGTHAERADQAIEIIKNTCKQHKYDISKVIREFRADFENENNKNENNKEIVVGGATIFVVETEKIIKV
ncbi:MAG TPA: cyclic-di-AMP receptor [Clostridia bacterium]